MVLVSAAFVNAPKLAAFLRYVVEAELAGRGDRIKAYTIAVDALGRPASFDPDTDAIVRVDANRIRRALEQYYRGMGAGDSVVIGLPGRHYVPTFSRRAPQPQPAPAVRSSPRDGRRALISGIDWLSNTLGSLRRRIDY